MTFEAEPLLWELGDEDVPIAPVVPAEIIEAEAVAKAVHEVLAADEEPAATAVSQRLAPGGGGGGCWLGGPKTASSEKFGNVDAAPDGFALFGRNLFGDDIQPKSGGALADRFTLPPFSVLNAREGAWQDRKRAWLSLGIQSELGRGGGTGTWVESGRTEERAGRQLQEPRQARRLPTAAPGGSARPACDYSKRQRGDGRGRPIDG